MKFTALPLAGAYLIEPEPVVDERGCNARLFCEREFAERGLATRMVQTNLIHNERRGTLRGLHWQEAPHSEAKLFRVTHGAIYDLILDLRRDSDTWGCWTSIELRAGDGMLLYVPAGFAQGFQTLEDATDITYQVSSFYSPAHGRGIRYDDPMFGFVWPLEVSAISEKDLSWPRWERAPAVGTGRA